MINKKRFLQKTSNSICKRLMEFVNLNSDFYIAAKPDYVTELNKIENFHDIYKEWIQKSKKANSIDLTRLYMLHMQIDRIKSDNIDGDIAELGVYRGSTAKIFKKLLPNKELYLFDTFEGFDKRDTEAKGSKGDFAESLENVMSYVGAERVHYIKGYFPESAEKLDPEVKFSLVHLDADLLNPQLAGLEFFYPKLAKGGIIIVHDCNNYFEGSREALDKFCSEYNVASVLMPDKSGSAIIQKV
jgi:hypothetical protein